MHILLYHNARIPVTLYGGAERVVWWLGKALVGLGHEVTYLVKSGSTCPFARVLAIDETRPLAAQIPDRCDMVHLHEGTKEELPKPRVITLHGNIFEPHLFHPNTVFLSRNHAQRHGGSVFVHNCLDFEDYGRPNLRNDRHYFHFLGNAAWRVKNVRGAIDLATRTGERLHVIGGTRVNFRMGFRITWSPRVRFHGMLGGERKNAVLNGSKGLLFPVLWPEPFGLAIIESLYFGSPVFGTPYGALPELLGMDVPHDQSAGGEAHRSEWGCLSRSRTELVNAMRNVAAFDRQRCHEYARDNFTAERMAVNYLRLYERVLNGQPLHAEPPKIHESPGKSLLTMIE